MKIINKTIIRNVLLCGVFSFLATGCSSSWKGSAGSDEPYGQFMKKKHKLSKKGILSAIGLAESQDLQTAIHKSELEARGELSRILESKNSSLQKSFRDEVGAEFSQHFQEVTKNVSSAFIAGSSIEEVRYKEDDDGRYKAFALIILDPEEYAKTLEAKMAAQKAMKTRFLASKAYKELTEEIEAYEEYKQNQGF